MFLLPLNQEKKQSYQQLKIKIRRPFGNPNGDTSSQDVVAALRLRCSAEVSVAAILLLGSSVGSARPFPEGDGGNVAP